MKDVTINDKIEYVVEIIQSIQDENIKNILLESIGQGLNLIQELFDEDGNYVIDKKTGNIDSIKIFENFFNVSISDIIANFNGAENCTTCTPDIDSKNIEFIKDSDKAIMDFITESPDVSDVNKKSEEDYQNEIKEKLKFVNSIIDNVK